MEDHVYIEAGSLRLEGIFAAAENRPMIGGMVICHPHPQYGGDMYNSVVVALRDAALDAGYASLRFNFRGVGASRGSHEGGVGEKEDVKAAIEHLRGRLHGDAAEIIVAGYSFGAFVGAMGLIEEGSVSACVLVSPPVDMMDFSPLKSAPLKTLFIAGDRDPFCPLSSLKDFRKDMTGENSLQVIRGADHFYLGLEDQITLSVAGFLRSAPAADE